MGNTVKRAAYYLGDPHLVRSIQEQLGVKQIQSSADQGGDLSEETRNSIRSNGNGVIFNATAGYKWLAGKSRKRVKHPETSTSVNSSVPSESYITVEIFPVLNIFFRLASEFGHEAFYISFFPFLVWNADTSLGRHLVMVWCCSMYVGQACKVLFKCKRPACPPAIRIGTNPILETEYGLPSTHATVATTVPFYIVYFLYHHYNWSLWVGLPFAVFWCFSVSLSRIYLGVHTVLDVLAGLVTAAVMLLLCLPAIPYIDWFVFDFEYTLVTAPLIVVALLYIYPVEPERWSMDRGDTAAILGVGLGAVLGCHIHGRTLDDLDLGPYELVLPSLQVVGVSIVRFVVGVLLLLPTRFIMKLLCFRLLPLIMPTHGVQEVVKRPLVELPYKIITYSMISLNVATVSFYVFEICNISRF